MKIETAARRLLAVLACTTVLGSAAWAEDEDQGVDFQIDVIDGGTVEIDEYTFEDGVVFDGELGEEFVEVDPAPEDNPEIYETGVVDEGESLADGGSDGDSEEPVEEGEPVAYGPDDCIDCNVGITSVDGEARGGSEVERDFGGAGDGSVVSRSESGGSGRPSCASLKPHDMTPCD